MQVLSHLGEILITQGVSSPEKINEALEKQKAKGGWLGDILIEMEAITEPELLQALSYQMSIPFWPKIELEIVDIALCSDISRSFVLQYSILPIRREDDVIIVAISNPIETFAIDDLRIILKAEISLVLATKLVIEDTSNYIYEKLQMEAKDVVKDIQNQFTDIAEDDVNQDVLAANDEAAIIRFVNNLFIRALKERASDIHVEPFEKYLLVRFRIDGVLYEKNRLPKGAKDNLLARIKLEGKLRTDEKRLPQDGKIQKKIAGKDIDIRLSTIPTQHGESAVMRLLDKSKSILELSVIGFDDQQLGMIDSLIHKSHGILLVTGPTGSGKTTTLYACLNTINAVDKKIITIEDPVEYELYGINQIHVRPDIGLTFASGLRAILRQDPDVIMVGEIRDRETADIAIQSSLTGHLVFSTLHTNDAASAVTRLIDMGVEPFLVASSVVAIMAQRLVRRLCSECKIRYAPLEQEMLEIGLDPYDVQNSNYSIYAAKPGGCDNCDRTGYKGRTGIYEIMMMDDDIRALVMANADASAVKQKSVKKGMKTLRLDGAKKILWGITTFQEVYRVSQDDTM